MKFRPCIDIHNGFVKQIVGGTLQDAGGKAENNFVSEYSAAHYAKMYQRDGFSGGHIILLNPEGSEWYEKDLLQAAGALECCPGNMQIGGGVNLYNAEKFLKMGASHVIVTSFVFQNGVINYERLQQLSSLIGKEHLVLDLSCRKYTDGYYIVTDRWQKKTEEKISAETMIKLAAYCDEFLIHAVDVEGKHAGVEKEVVQILAESKTLPITYAGGIHDMDDIKYIEETGQGNIDFTIGSALDLFGGHIPYQDLKKYRGTC